MVDPDILWRSLLSRDPDRIRETWDLLDTDERAAIHEHLTKMATESGWTEPQRISAQAALDTLDAPSAPDQAS
jgi:hypothetical protein